MPAKVKLLETIKIVGTDSEFIIINKSDFDPAIHSLFKDSEATVPIKSPKPVLSKSTKVSKNKKANFKRGV